MGNITNQTIINNNFSNPALPTKFKAAQSQSINQKTPEVSDISTAVEEHKSLSLTYQLMLAIARENGEQFDKHQNLSIGAKYSKELQLESHQTFSFSLTNESQEQQFQVSTQVEFMSTNTNNSALRLTTGQQTSFSLIAEEENLTNKRSDPLILNLDNSDFSFNPHQSILFDINANGSLDKIANIKSGSSFLAYDKNNNSIIDNGTELFGDAGGAIDGFDDLQSYDSNGDNQIDAQDRIFESLLLLNFDPQGQQVVRALSTEQITRLSLEFNKTNLEYQNNNLLISESNFQRRDGGLGRIGDFLLTVG
jgi:hypothetical protein